MKNKDMKPIVLTQRPEPIEGDMDFDQVLSGYRRVRFRKTIIQYGIPLLVMLGAAILLLNPEDPTVQDVPVLDIDTMILEQTEEPTEELVIEEPETVEIPQNEPVEEVVTEVEKEVPVQPEAEKSQDSYNPEVPISVFTNAEPIAGYEALYVYFDKEIQYPDTLVSQKISGTVVVRFAIGKNGRAEQITIEESLHELLDQEAIRLIRAMPDWKPATANGKPVISFMSIPITFNITQNEKE